MGLRPLNVRIGANTESFDRGIAGSVRGLDQFRARTQQTMVAVARSAAVAVTAFAALTGGILAAANEAAQAGTEIRNLANVAGTGTTQFQKMAAATRSVGIEQEKLSDILKDVNDKFGDYMSTGAGPLADFFEQIAPKIGVTADQFARLSGPEALQLYVSSLEKAGVSQQEMTFYMEALASDATGLIPLLQNGGRALKDMGDEAERAGRILSEEMIDNAVELDRELAALANTIKMQATVAVLEHKDELVLLIGFITESVIPAISTFVEKMSLVALGWQTIGKAAQDAIGPLARALGLSDELPGLGAQISPEKQALWDADQSAFQAADRALGGGDVSETGTRNFDPFSSAADQPLYGAGVPEIPGITTPAGSSAEDALEAYIEERKRLFEARQDANSEIEEEESRHGSRLTEIVDQSEDDAQRIRDRYAQMEMSMRKQTFQGAVGLLQQFGQENKAFAKAAVILNAAQRVSEISANTAAASTRALAELGPIAGPPAAAKIAAFGATQKAIALASAAMSLGGGGSSGGGGAGGGAGGIASVSQASPQTQNVTIDLVGASGSQVDNFQQFANTLNEAARQGLLTNLSVRGV